MRKPSAGRKKTTAKDPSLLPDLQALVDATTRRDPDSPLLWTARSQRNLVRATGRCVCFSVPRTADSGVRVRGWITPRAIPYGLRRLPITRPPARTRWFAASRQNTIATPDQINSRAMNGPPPDLRATTDWSQLLARCNSVARQERFGGPRTRKLASKKLSPRFFLVVSAKDLLGQAAQPDMRSSNFLKQLFFCRFREFARRVSTGLLRRETAQPIAMSGTL